MIQSQHKVLIIGGGFGGIKAALELSKSKSIEIELITDHEDFRYYPSLYHTATGGSKVASSIPLSEIFAGKKVRVIIDRAKKLDRRGKTLTGESGQKYSFDSLIIALGVVTNFFGIKGLEEFSYGIKTNAEAQELRDHLHTLIFDEQKPDLNYVVIGGGPTGIELAGALPTYLGHIIKRHGIGQKNIHVDLVEAMPRLAPRMTQRYSHKIQKRLKELGVKLYLNETVKAETADKLVLSDKPLASHTVVWTAGVTNHPFLKKNNFELNEHGKAKVNEILQAERDIYVIGDNADTPYSGMAQTALHDGILVARNIIKAVNGKTLAAYKPRRPIYVTPAGPRWAAVQWGKIEVYGIIGWLLRSTADFIAYHDLEPWWKASKHWIAQANSQESCPICANNR